MPVLSFVLYHGNEAWRVEKSLLAAVAKHDQQDDDDETLALLRLLFSDFFYLLIDLTSTPDVELLAVPLIGIALYTLKHIRSMTEDKITIVIQHGYRLPYEHRKTLMWGIMHYVQAAHPHLDAEVFEKIGDKVYRDMVKENPCLKEEEGMAKPLSFDFEDALADREAEGLVKGIQQGKLAAQRDIALSLLKQGIPEATVCNTTKLSRKEVQLLKKSL